MCIICIDFERGALRANEARRALREMSDDLPPEHVQQIEQKLAEAEANPKPPATP